MLAAEAALKIGVEQGEVKLGVPAPANLHSPLYLLRDLSQVSIHPGVDLELLRLRGDLPLEFAQRVHLA